MSEDDDPKPSLQPLDYASPRDTSGRASALRAGFVLGILAPVLVVPGCALVGSWLDARANPNAELAGLGGLFFGGITAFGLLAVGAVVALVVGRRRDKPLLRGVALGIFFMVGAGAITLGICAVA